MKEPKMYHGRKKIGELLCDKSFLEQSQLDTALLEQKNVHKPLGQILLELGYISNSQLNEALSVQSGIEKVDLADLSAIDRALTSLVPAELVTRYNLLPLSQTNGSLTVGMMDPFQPRVLEHLRIVTGLRIDRRFVEPEQLQESIRKLYGSNVARMLDDLVPGEHHDSSAEGGENGHVSTDRLHELAREPSLVNLVNLIILEAIQSRASDIHIEPFEKQVKVKYRIDGILVEKTPTSKRLQSAIISRIKIMGDMNIAERFVPQDGHIEFATDKGKVDIRVSTVPTIFGESLTLRILDRSASLMRLSDLGMDQMCLDGFSRALAKSHGIVLVTGPTGSGKTTTLYAALNQIYSPSLKIITIEDPVEYQLDGVIQMPVNPKRGLTFAKGLRHILRQDPDIVMVGEIRDRETADIAIRAALTGHLVFSTLHTNNAPGAVTRLLDMGMEPFLLANSLESVMAQRLVRCICLRCKEVYQPEPALLKSINGLANMPDTTFYRGKGCNECMNTGMKGRMGVFELLRITPKLREIIAGRGSVENIVKAAPPDHVSIRSDGINKVLAGITTCQELLRVTQVTEE